MRNFVNKWASAIILVFFIGCVAVLLSTLGLAIKLAVTGATATIIGLILFVSKRTSATDSLYQFIVNDDDESFSHAIAKLPESAQKMPQSIKSRIENSVSERKDLVNIVLATSAAKTLPLALQKLIESSTGLLNAQYGALTTFDDAGKLSGMYTTGMSEKVKAGIAHTPQGKGLLGHLGEHRETMRLKDMKTHPKSVDFPGGHPPMHSMLATPITYEGKLLGNFYFTETFNETKEFSPADESLIKDLAIFVAIAINDKIKAAQAKEDNEYLSTEVSEIRDAMIHLSEGNLSLEVSEATKNDAIGELKTALRGTISKWRNLVGDVRNLTTSVSEASHEVGSSTEELAAGIQEQSQQTTEIAAAVEEMTRTVADNSANVSRSSDAAADSEKTAREGGDIVDQTVRKMNSIADSVISSASTVERLGESSAQIGEIISVIDEIADQTNLLALNAAIEAARAGEQGRGFAVVADEVRKLAERTGQATSQISNMIKTIQAETNEAVKAMAQGKTEVEEGIILADNSGKALQSIVENVHQIASTMEHVAAASLEQSSTTDEIARNIEVVSNVSRQANDNVGAIAASANQLVAMTTELDELVGQFKL